MLIAAEAERLTTRIQLRLGNIADNTEAILPMIEAARTGEAAQALGYASWTAYVSDKFGGTLARLGKAERLPFVELMADEGMSTRAIAAVLDVDHSTVVRDQNQVVQPAPPDREDDADRRVTGVDGKSYKATSKPVVEPGKPRRRAFPDAYWHAIYELQKSVERIERLHADDRFAAHREVVHEKHWRQVLRATAILDSAGYDLDGLNKCGNCDERMLPDGEYETRCVTCREGR